VPTVGLPVSANQMPASKSAPKIGGAKNDRKNLVLLLRGLIDESGR
jgi:hypothetical protein